VIDQDAEGRVTNRFLVTASGSPSGMRSLRGSRSRVRARRARIASSIAIVRGTITSALAGTISNSTRSAQPLRRRARAHAVHGNTLVVARQRRRRRVGEPTRVLTQMLARGVCTLGRADPELVRQNLPA